VKDEIVDRVARRVQEGMGLIVLHSGHFSKIFKRLMGTPCALKWREAGENERIWILNRNHPIVAGLPEQIFIEHEEMYGEPFSIPEPMETLMISWFEGGEVFRSGVTYQRGAGKIFYFRPGHEAYPTFHNPQVLQVIRNATRWAHNPAPAWKAINDAPNVPHDKAPVPLEVKGPSLHAYGEEGYR
jgi:trehalose utilization protein